jgi:hypothetical protein
VQLRRSQHIRPRLWDTVNFDVDRTEAVAQAANAQRMRLRANRPRDRDHLRLAGQDQRREAHDCVSVLLGHGLATNDGIDRGDDVKAIGFVYLVREGRHIVTEVGGDVGQLRQRAAWFGGVRGAHNACHESDSERQPRGVVADHDDILL